MNRLFSLILILATCFSLVACGNGNVSLRTVIENIELDFQASVTDTVISYQDKTYRFNNKFENFTTEMLTFFEEVQVSEAENYTDTEKTFSISFWDINSNYIFLYFNEADQIRVTDDGEIDLNYTCSGVYEKVLQHLQPIIEETDKYYKLEQSVDIQTSFYEIYSKSGAMLEQNMADRNPHILRISDEVVHLWIQEGTGASGIINTFYNWKTGAISKSCYGYTDTYQSYLCCGAKNKIEISKLFEDEILYTIDEFERPLSDMEDSIIMAYFTNDGTQIQVQYIDENYEIVDETIDVPKDVMNLG